MGMIIVGAAPNESKDKQGLTAQSNEAVTSELRDIVKAIEKVNSAPHPDMGCPVGKEDRSSDLCAQWKAADAANDAAVSARKTFRLGIVGTIIGFFTLVAAGLAARYAKSAANETKRAADIATSTLEEARKNTFEQIKIAQQGLLAAINGQRAWLSANLRITDQQIRDDQLHFTFFASAKNIGNTPALNIIVAFDNFEGVQDAHRKNRLKMLNHKLTNNAPISGCLLPNAETMGVGGQFSVALDRGKTSYPSVNVAVAYKIIGSDEVHITVAGFAIQARGPKGQCPINSAPDFDNIELIVCDAGMGHAT